MISSLVTFLYHTYVIKIVTAKCVRNNNNQSSLHRDTLRNLNRGLKTSHLKSYCTFLNIYLVIPTECGRDIARGKENLVREYGLKCPLPWEMGTILNVKTISFLHFFLFTSYSTDYNQTWYLGVVHIAEREKPPSDLDFRKWPF